MKRLHRITDFSGGIRQDVAADQVPQNALVECKGFEVSKKTGALVRQLGWEDSGDTFEAGSGVPIVGTPVAGTSYVLEEPSGPKEIKILASDLSGYPHIYVKPQWTGSWVNDDPTLYWIDIQAYIKDFTRNLYEWSALSGSWSDYLVRDGILRVAMGHESISDYPVWFGIVKAKHFPGKAGAVFRRDEYENGLMVCDVAALTPPEYEYFNTSGVSVGDGACLSFFNEVPPTYQTNLAIGTYQFALSLVYDGFQESPLGVNVCGGEDNSDGRTLVDDTCVGAVGGLATYEVTDSLCYDAICACVCCADTEAKMNPRWTAMKVYLKFTPSVEPSARAYHAPFDWTEIATVPITERFEETTGSIAMEDGWFLSSYPGSSYFAMKCILRIQNIDALTGMTYWDSSGNTEASAWMRSVYSRIGAAGDQVFIGNVRDYISSDNGTSGAIFDYSIRYAARQGSHGQVAPDLLPPLYFAGTETQAGEGPIQAIEENYGRIVVIREHSLTELTPSATTEFVLKIKSAFAGVGCISPDTVVKIGDTIIFASEHAVWKYDGLECVPISEPIKDWWDLYEIADKKDSFAAYFPQDHQYWLAVKRQSTQIMVYDVRRGAWTKSVAPEENMLALFAGSDESVYSLGTNALYTRDDDGYIDPSQITTGQLTFEIPDVWKRYRDMYIIHEDTGAGVSYDTMHLYVDGSDMFSTETLPVATARTTTKYHLDSAKGKRIQLDVSNPSNTTAKKTIHEIGFYYDTRKI